MHLHYIVLQIVNILIVMSRFLYLLLNFVIFYSCSSKPVLWPDNNSASVALFYNLCISDTSKIFQKGTEGFSIIDIKDLEPVKRDTIFYNAPGDKVDEFFSGCSIESSKMSSSNRSVVEYYTFDDQAVKFAGYSTSDKHSSLIKFSNPLVIIPAQGVKTDSSSAKKLIWNSNSHNFTEGENISTVVQLVESGIIRVGEQSIEFLLYELTLKSDARVQFGGQSLLVPDDIVFKSKLLFSEDGSLLYEWSIKQEISKEEHDPAMPSDHRIYVEFIQYNPLSH